MLCTRDPNTAIYLTKHDLVHSFSCVLMVLFLSLLFRCSRPRMPRPFTLYQNPARRYPLALVGVPLPRRKIVERYSPPPDKTHRAPNVGERTHESTSALTPAPLGASEERARTASALQRETPSVLFASVIVLQHSRTEIQLT